MSGHSKWANIRIRKSKQDSDRGRLFGRLAREILVAARSGGSLDGNPRLRLAVERARAASMPNDSIERAIKRGTGEIGGAAYEEVQYEGYGPGGVAVLVEAMTDNRNRTVADVRKTFSRHGGALGEAGCVAWLFHKKGLITVERGEVDEEQLMEVAIESGAEDFTTQDGVYEIITPYEAFETVRNELRAQGHTPSVAEITYIPSTRVPLDGEAARKMVRLMHALEDLEDVQSVNANFDIPDAILEEAE